MNIKKVLLVSLVLLVLVFPSTGFLSGAAVGPCGCDDSYMGASYIGSYCTFVDGVMVQQTCYYEY